MNDRDKKAFAALMTGVAELYSKKISDRLLTIYWGSLQRFDFSDVKRAVEAHLNDPEAGQYMVKPSDVVRHIEGNGEMRALQALSKVESAVRHIGSYTNVAFDDPIIHAVISDMGGWVRFCSCKSNDAPFQANEFMKRYQGYLQRGLERYPCYLIGALEQSNQFYAYQYKALPALVGDVEKIKKVMQEGKGSTVLIHRAEYSQLTHDIERLQEMGKEIIKT